MVPRSPRSLRLSDVYRTRLVDITERAQRQAVAEWPTIDRLDGTQWPERVASVVARAQKEATRATSGYLSAFLSSELDRRIATLAIATEPYVGMSRDGRPLAEALQSPIIGVRAALKDGKSAGEALAFGRLRALRMVEMDAMHAARSALTDTVKADERFDGWQRLTAGTCGACMALSGTSGPHFHVHPGCKCVPQPKVKGVPDSVPVKSGDEMFAALTAAQQDKQFGPEKAALLRAGAISLADLVDRSELDSDQADFITEKPLEAATT